MNIRKTSVNIGCGIAGLALVLFLKEAAISATVCEAGSMPITGPGGKSAMSWAIALSACKADKLYCDF